MKKVLFGILFSPHYSDSKTW